MIYGTIATTVNFYLVCSFIFSSKLRDTVNYSIFLLTLVDFLTTGLGYMLYYIAHEFILYHESNFEEMHISRGIDAYWKMRREIQDLVQRPIAQIVSPFWFGCLPRIFIMRLNEYGNGLCSALIAYERFVMICKPLSQSTLLGSRRQKIRYVIVTVIIFSIFVGECVNEFMQGHYRCHFVNIGINNDQLQGHLLNLASNLLFSLVPAIFCFYCYYQTARVLLSRKKKVGQNFLFPLRL